MKNLFFIMTALLLVSCSEKEDDYLCCANQVHMDGVEMSVRNSDGSDLLNPNNPNAYSADEIKLFYEIDGEVVEVYDPAMDLPRNFMIFNYSNETESEYRIRLLPNYDRNESQPITYIQWNETDRDTIKAEFYYSGPEDSNYSFTIENLWFNGEPKNPYFDIVK